MSSTDTNQSGLPALPYLRDLRAIRRAGGLYLKFEFETNLETSDLEAVVAALPTATRAKLIYSRVYSDPSCGAELTMTIKTLDAPVAYEICEAIGATGTSTMSCGLHISVMPTHHYSRERCYKTADMDTFAYLSTHDKRDNFQREVSKLLPGLYACATSDGKTRGLRFREPKVSLTDKYHAIYMHNGTCFEYRVFDPCYGRPEALYEYLGTIARTLEYLSLTKRVSLKSKEFRLTVDHAIADSLDSLENLQAMNETLRYVMPKYASAKDFKKARGLTITRADLSAIARKRLTRYRLEHQAYTLEQRAHFLREFSNWLHGNRHDLGPIATNDLAFMQAEFSRLFPSVAKTPMTLDAYAQDQANRLNRYGKVTMPLDGSAVL